MEPASKIPRMQAKKQTSNEVIKTESLNSNCQPWIASEKCLSALCNREDMADFHFWVGEGDSKIKVPVHKLVLGSGSPVFYALFYGPLATQDAEVHVPDIEPAVFLLLLKFIYAGEISLDEQTVMRIWYAAKKYAVTALESHCELFLENSIDRESVFLVLNQARMFDAPGLVANCLEYIDINTVAIVNAGSCRNIDYETWCLFLERDTLRITEYKLFEALIFWGKAQCQRASVEINRENVRLVLGHALHLIRFPLMTIKEFTFLASRCCILTELEMIEMFLYLNAGPKPAVCFSTVPRGYKNVSYEVARFQGHESGWKYQGYHEVIGVRASRSILIVGIGFYGPIQGTASYTIALKIKLKETKVMVGSLIATQTGKADQITFRVNFKTPVRIEGDTDFIVSTAIWGPESFCGHSGQRSVSVDVPGYLVQFDFSPVRANGNSETNVEHGQIPIIYFHI